MKLILMFMVPVYLGNIFQQFYNLADAMVAGRFLGVDALAAIGSTTSLIFLVIGWLNGITSGFAILIAQCFGAGKYDQMRHYLAMSIYLCIGFTILMTAGLLRFNVPILEMMNAPDELVRDIADYLAIIYGGLFVTAAYNGLAAVLRALGDSRSPLYFLIISAIINVFLDIIFIAYFHMGVEGCGYATVIAQGISAILCLVYMIKKFSILKLEKRNWEFSFSSAAKLLGLGVPMGLQFSITAIGTIIVQGAVNIYGAAYMAGYSAAGKIQNMISTIFIAYGATIATYVSQNRGAGKMERVHQGVRICQIMILITSVFVMGAVWFGGPFLTALFIENTETEAMEAAMVYYKAVVLFYPFLGSIFLYRNALQGLGYGLVPMMGGVFELLARAAVIMAAGGFGFLGVCMADPMAWLAALIPIVPYYFVKMKQIKNGKGELV